MKTMFKPTDKMLSIMDKIENRRIKINKQKPSAFFDIVIFLTVSIIFIGGGVLAIMITHQPKVIYFILSFILAGMVMFVLVTLLESKKSKITKKYEENNSLYINEIFLPLLKSININFTYEKSSQIYEKYEEQYKEVLMEIRESKNKTVALDGKKYIKTNGEIKGAIDNIDISIAQFYFKESKGDEFCNSHQIFFVANFNKKLKSITVLNPPFPHIFKRRMYNKILLDNQAFNKNFKTYCNDEIESRYILTPLFMEKMVKISKELNGTFWFEGAQMMFNGYFKNNNMTNYFGLNIDRPIYDQSKEFYNMIHSIIEMVKSLDLNSKVWK